MSLQATHGSPAKSTFGVGAGKSALRLSAGSGNDPVPGWVLEVGQTAAELKATRAFYVDLVKK
jgi:hypothetical protein